MVDWILARAKEPSSYAGIGVLLAAVGIHISDPMLSASITALTAVAALVALIKKETTS